MEKYADLRIDDVEVHLDCSGFTILWSSPSLGWGEFTLWIDTDHEVKYDSECMSNEFVSKLLSLLPSWMKRCE